MACDGGKISESSLSTQVETWHVIVSPHDLCLSWYGCKRAVVGGGGRDEILLNEVKGNRF